MYIFIMFYCIIFDKNLRWRWEALEGPGNCSNCFPRLVLLAPHEKFTLNYYKFIKKYLKATELYFPMRRRSQNIRAVRVLLPHQTPSPKIKHFRMRRFSMTFSRLWWFGWWALLEWFGAVARCKVYTAPYQQLSSWFQHSAGIL